MSALRLIADGCSIHMRIAAIGQLRSFEQTNKRSDCASFVKVIASIEDSVVIKKILAHLDQDAPLQQAGYLPETRAPPPMGLFV